MVRAFESLLIGSENAKRLAEFYQDKVGLKITLEAEVGEKGEGLYELGVDKKGLGVYIMDHSKVKGRNLNPDRIIFNLEVDDIEKEVKEVEKAGVKKVADIYHVEGYGFIATFEDIDGNYFQFVQVRPS